MWERPATIVFGVRHKKLFAFLDNAGEVLDAVIEMPEAGEVPGGITFEEVAWTRPTGSRVRDEKRGVTVDFNVDGLVLTVDPVKSRLTRDAAKRLVLALAARSSRSLAAPTGWTGSGRPRRTSLLTGQAARPLSVCSRHFALSSGSSRRQRLTTSPCGCRSGQLPKRPSRERASLTGATPSSRCGIARAKNAILTRIGSMSPSTTRRTSTRCGSTTATWSRSTTTASCNAWRLFSPGDWPGSPPKKSPDEPGAAQTRHQPRATGA